MMKIIFRILTLVFALLPEVWAFDYFVYSGALLDRNGFAIVVNSTINFEISLYDSASGANSAYKQQFDSVPVKNGLFKLRIGPGLPDLNRFNFMELVVDGVPLDSRISLLPNPLAIGANRANISENSVRFGGMTTQEFLALSSTGGVGPTVALTRVEVLESQMSDVRARALFTNETATVTASIVMDSVTGRLQFQGSIPGSTPSTRILVYNSLGQSAFTVKSDGEVIASKFTGNGSGLTNVEADKLRQVTIVGTGDITLVGGSVLMGTNSGDGAGPGTIPNAGPGVTGLLTGDDWIRFNNNTGGSGGSTIPTNVLVKTDIVDNLITSATDKVLSASRGVFIAQELQTLRTDLNAVAAANGAPVTLTKNDVGLGNVANLNVQTAWQQNKGVSIASDLFKAIDSDGLKLQAADGTGIQVRPSGRVGINSSSPAAALEVKATGSFHVFGAYAAGDSTPAMFVTTAGFVGVRMQNPVHELDVAGTIRAQTLRGDGSNITGITKAQIGLTNVPNTNIAYANPIAADAFNATEVGHLRAGRLSDGTQPWNNNEATLAPGTVNDYLRGDRTWQLLNKGAVGLSNVTNNEQLAKAQNLSDLPDKPQSRTNLGLGTIATQNSNTVAITGGTVNGTVIGGATPAAATFTTVNATTFIGDGSQLTGLNIPSAGTIASQNFNAVSLTGGSINNIPIGTATPSTGRFTTVTANSFIGDGSQLTGITKASIGLGNVPNTNIQYSSAIAADQFNGTEVGNLRANRLADGTEPWANREPLISSGTTNQFFRGDKTWQTLSASQFSATEVGNLRANFLADGSTPWTNKENSITAGTTAQYFRGDKSWQTLDKTAVGLSNVPNTNIQYSSAIPADQFLSGEVTNLRASQLANGSTPWTLKENAITAGTTAQYFRGDKTWQTLDKAAIGLSNVPNTHIQYSTAIAADQFLSGEVTNLRASQLANGSTPWTGKENAITAGTTAQYFRGDKTWQTLDKTAVGLNNVPNTHIQYSSAIAADQFLAGEVTNLRASQLADGSTPWTAKENAITAGTSLQYFRGDKTWQTLNATAVGLANVTNDLQLKRASNLLDLQDVNAARTNLGLGTMAEQNASAVAITGGSINATTIGISNASQASFTVLTAQSMRVTGSVTITQSLTVTGNVTAAFFYGDGSNLTGLPNSGSIAAQNSDNISLTGGTINNIAIGASTASAGRFTTVTAVDGFYGTIKTAHQLDITRVGTLESLNVSGATTFAAGLEVTGTVNATGFSGSGSSLTGVVKSSGAENISGVKTFQDGIVLQDSPSVSDGTMKFTTSSGFEGRKDGKWVPLAGAFKNEILNDLEPFSKTNHLALANLVQHSASVKIGSTWYVVFASNGIGIPNSGLKQYTFNESTGNLTTQFQISNVAYQRVYLEVINGEHYCFALTGQNGAAATGHIFKWDAVNNRFGPAIFQSLTLGNSYSWEFRPVTIGTDHFILFPFTGVAAAPTTLNQRLRVYKWDGASFVVHQDLAAGIINQILRFASKILQVGSKYYMIFASTQFGAVLFEYNPAAGGSFISRGILNGTLIGDNGLSAEMFSIGSDSYLAVGTQIATGDLLIFKWDGVDFAFFQRIRKKDLYPLANPFGVIYDVTHMQRGDATYLVLASEWVASRDASHHLLRYEPSENQFKISQHLLWGGQWLKILEPVATPS